MRQVVKAPIREYTVLILAACSPVVFALLDDPSGSWQDYLPFLALVSIFYGLGAFLLNMVRTMVVSVYESTLMVRETSVPLDDIIACTVIDGPPEAKGDMLRYRRETQDRLLLFVPGWTDRMVEVTLANGKRIAFSAADPDAICEVLKTRCQNLA